MAQVAGADTVLVREEVAPRWAPFTLARPGLDGLLRRRGDARMRLLHDPHGARVVVAVAVRPDGRVGFAARAASTATAEYGIARMRFALGVDDDLEPFHAAFRDDPLIGAAVRRAPGLRVMRRPEPWEALAWAVTEQLIELDRAVEIQRRLVRALGRRCADTGLRDAPTPAAIAGSAPAALVAHDLAPKRALALRRAAAEVASGRVRLVPHTGPAAGETGHAGFERLRAIRDIGTWTLDCLALHGLGRLDVVAAGDLSYLKLVGRLVTGRPKAFADEDEVRGLLARYHPWAGLAGEYLRSAPAGSLRLSPRPAARPAGTRWSAAPRSRSAV